MFDFGGNRIGGAVRSLLVAVSVATLLPIAACKKQESTAVQAGPMTFASPEDAGKALAAAAKSQDQNAILQIFGPGSGDILSSGNPAADKASLDGLPDERI